MMSKTVEIRLAKCYEPVVVDVTYSFYVQSGDDSVGLPECIAVDIEHVNGSILEALDMYNYNEILDELETTIAEMEAKL